MDCQLWAKVEPLEDETYGLSEGSQASSSTSLHLVNLGRIAEDKRNKLKSILTSCIDSGRKDHKLIAKNVEARLGCLRKNKDDFTDDQAIAEINKKEPEEGPDKLTNMGASKVSSRNEDLVSSTASPRSSLGDQTYHEPEKKDHLKVSTKIKRESVHLLDTEPTDAQEERKKNAEEVDSASDIFVTPKQNKSQRSKKSCHNGTAKKSLILDKSRKITDYFPITSKSRTPIAQRNKNENEDPAFILSALKGDPNHCIVCKKKFGANYIKKHLVDQHGIDRESIRSRPIKTEIGYNELPKDTKAMAPT